MVQSTPGIQKMWTNMLKMHWHYTMQMASDPCDKLVKNWFHTSTAYQVHFLKGLGFFHKPIWHFSKKNHGLCSTNIPPCLPPGCSVRKGAVCMFPPIPSCWRSWRKKNVSSHPSVGPAESIGLKCFSSSFMEKNTFDYFGATLHGGSSHSHYRKELILHSAPSQLSRR